METNLVTPLYEEHLRLNGKMVEFAGFLMPIQYEGIKEEHLAVRNGVGIFDVSHMGEFYIQGDFAKEFINMCVTNDIRNLKDGQVMYSPMCNDKGGTVDDILIYRLNEKKYLLVVNAGNINKDFQHLLSFLPYKDVELTNKSSEIGEIAIQGPKAINIMNKLSELDFSNMKYYYFMEDVRIGNANCIVSRTGYTGEDGFEIYFKSEDSKYIWNLLLEVGLEENIKPCGLGCRDTLRFEAGMPLFGHELSDSISPIEAGLEYFVKFEKEFFIGKESLINLKTRRNLIGIQLIDKIIARQNSKVLNENLQEIGWVTTGYPSITLEKSLALALVNIELEIGKKVYIEVRNKTYEGIVINKKFYKKIKNK